ncbi:MAG TPA: hypothetical protein VH062_31280 [Polyangiaceae bacterium]|jgi:hypothetical protein|nr:hypothetical protein [Polyangiaceae bacterium]
MRRRWPRELVIAVCASAAAVISCGHTEPSRTPLSVSPPSDVRTQPSSSRAVEASDDDDERNDIEIVVAPSDDDGDDSTKVLDCASLAAPTSCLGASIAQRTCEKLGPAVLPRVGAAWMKCMHDPSKGSPCDGNRIVQCGLGAVTRAKTDGAYSALCTQIAASCSDVAEQITAPVCEQLIAAWKPERRSQMIECLSHGCETGGFGICLP